MSLVRDIDVTATPSVVQQLARLDGAESSLVLASGVAALACTMVALLRPGDHMLASSWLSPETRRFFESELPALGVQVSFVDPTETRGWRRALTRTTRMLYVESPVSFSTRVIDMRPPRTLAQELGVALIVDTTFASPVNFRAMEFGADVVLHSASAFVDGDGDGAAGIVCGSEGVIDEVRTKMQTWGAEPHAEAISSLARGLTTLSVRVQQQNATALAVAQWAAVQPSISSVWYPGLASHPDHVIANECLAGHGSVILLHLAGAEAGTEAAANKLLTRLQTFRVDSADSLATTAGIGSAAGIAAPALPALSGVPEASVRLSIGLNDAPTLIGDLTQALE